MGTKDYLATKLYVDDDGSRYWERDLPTGGSVWSRAEGPAVHERLADPDEPYYTQWFPPLEER